MKIHANYGVAALLFAASFSDYAAQAQTAPVAAQSGTLQQFLSGDLVPLDLKFSQMQKGWSRVNIERKGEEKTSSEASNFVPPDPIAAGFRRYFGEGSDAVWTQGRTINLNGAEQLVVYRAQFPSFNETDAWFEAHTPAEPEKFRQLEPEQQFDMMFPVVRQFLDTVPIRASLVSVSDITSLRDAEPFVFERAFAALESDVRAKEGAANAQRNRNRAQNSRISLEFLSNGFKQYLLDYDKVLPPLDNWEAANKALQPYLKSEIKLALPDQKIHTNPLLSGKKLAHLQPYAQSLVVFYSDPDQSGNRWVVYLSGNVQQINENQWPQLKKASRLP